MIMFLPAHHILYHIAAILVNIDPKPLIRTQKLYVFEHYSPALAGFQHSIIPFTMKSFAVIEKVATV